MITDLNKDKTIIAHKIVFRNTKTIEGRLSPAEVIEKEPLNQEIFEIRQRFGQIGTFRFLCTFMNDSYIGFDKECMLEFSIVKDDVTREVPDYDQETLNALKGPGLIQGMLDIKEEESSDDSDGEKPTDEVEALKAKLKRAGLEKALERS